MDNLSTVTNHSSAHSSQPAQHSNTSTHTNHSSGSTFNNYQYALPTPGELPKSVYTDNPLAFDKSSDKQSDDGVHFKNKIGIRRTYTGLSYEEQTRNFEYKYMTDDLASSANKLNSSVGNDGLLPMPALNSSNSSDYKIDFNNKETLAKMPAMPREEEESRSRIMKEQVRRISRVFN